MSESVLEKRATVSNILLAIAMVLLIISLAVVATLNFRQLYYYDITYLDIPRTSGYSETEIRENYDALIDYNSVFYRDKLSFPTLPMSETGEIHFEEVKVIFSSIQVIALTLLLPVAAAVIWKLRKKQYFFLKLSALLSILLPLIIGILIMLNWDGFFVLFHQIFFNNDYWVFDAITDPVITILPDTYFLHCAVIILLLVILTAVAMWFSHNLLVKRYARRKPVNQSM